MTVITFLSYILLSYGIANMIVYANGPFHVFEHWRNFTHAINEQFGEMFTCMMCLSTWIGLFLSLLDAFVFPGLIFTPFNIIFGSQGIWWITAILDMGFTSGSVWILHQFEEALERIGTATEVVYEDDTNIRPDIVNE